MTLINCPECGKSISDKAPACPTCGAPTAQSLSSPGTAKTIEMTSKRLKLNEIIATIFVLLGLLLFILGIASEGMGMPVFGGMPSFPTIMPVTELLPLKKSGI